MEGPTAATITVGQELTAAKTLALKESFEALGKAGKVIYTTLDSALKLVQTVVWTLFGIAAVGIVVLVRLRRNRGFSPVMKLPV